MYWMRKICDQQRYALRKLIADGWDDTISPKQRVLNDLERTRLAWFGSSSISCPASREQLISFSRFHPVCAAVRAFLRKSGRKEGVGEEPNHTTATAKKPGSLEIYTLLLNKFPPPLPLRVAKAGKVRHVTGTGSGLLGGIPRVVVQISALTLKGPL